MASWPSCFIDLWGKPGKPTITNYITSRKQEDEGRNVNDKKEQYLKVEVHFKQLISQSKFSGTRKFTLTCQQFKIPLR